MVHANVTRYGRTDLPPVAVLYITHHLRGDRAVSQRVCGNERRSTAVADRKPDPPTSELDRRRWSVEAAEGGLDRAGSGIPVARPRPAPGIAFVRAGWATAPRSRTSGSTCGRGDFQGLAGRGSGRTEFAGRISGLAGKRGRIMLGAVAAPARRRRARIDAAGMHRTRNEANRRAILAGPIRVRHSTRSRSALDPTRTARRRLGFMIPP